MTTSIVAPVINSEPRKCHKPRAAWRQRLVQAERGIGNGARQDSIFFVHIFTATLILLMGGVLGLLAWQWTMLLGSLVLLFVAELFNQALKSMALAFGETIPPPAQKALGMSTAASMLALGGVLMVAGFTLGQRMSEMFGG